MKIIFAISTAIVLIGGFYLWKYQIVPMAVPEDSEVQSDTSTSGWKVYSRQNMYEFSYPLYAEIKEASYVATDTTVVLTPDWVDIFDVTSHADSAYFCNTNPYKAQAANNPKEIKYTENKVTKYGNDYRHLHTTSASPTNTIIEDRYYIVKNDICYMIIAATSEKTDPAIKADIEKIFSTFKFI